MKLWGGRFSAQPDEIASLFNSSVSFDRRLYSHDIHGSIAHAQMLGIQGIIPQSDADLIVRTLGEILSEIEEGSLHIDLSAEDIHSFVESELVTRIGDAGRRLHTGRSRNDQVALDMRMYTKNEIREIRSLMLDLMNVLANSAKQHTKTIMPGFTHMQKAQPITLAHHLLAYFQMFKRDCSRLDDCYERTDENPLGSGALAATTYPINREYVREKLGFAKNTENSLDAVSDRDFCIELLFCISMIMTHLSRFCEEIVLWSTSEQEFGFVTVSDGYSTGSSIMPQKKNPDMAELIRGKVGRIHGNLVALLTVMKSLPLAYNKDMQEDKEAVFDSVDTVKSCLVVFTAMMETISFNIENMNKSASDGYTNATDAADWLVKKGVTFREAHEIIGRLVLYAIEKKSPLEALTIEEFKSVSEAFDETVYESITLEACVNSRKVQGGTSEGAVLDSLKSAEEFIRTCQKL
ncbi:MAG: argininosuccinate lyase [Oscillospiraceae bacterium]|nr:argininosuccinate lyase [Oscillospiraceae bacterium]